MKRRLAAIASLGLMATAVIVAVIAGVQQIPAWSRGARLPDRGGGRRVVGADSSRCGARCRRGRRGAFLIGAVALVAIEGGVVLDAVILAAFLISIAAARTVFAVPIKLPLAARPAQPVLFYNPKSGGGKAERFQIAREARARGVEPIELDFSEDLATLVRAAIDNGADAVGAAGGDGTQATVASVAVERGVPYVCVPAGTRNHFALDLGVDRNDVVGALDAFTNGGERIVDLAEVNGLVFVNNVSLGVYAEAVQRDGYRDAKLRTIADTVPMALGPGGHPLDLRWTRPDGETHETAAVLLVSNDPYRLGRVLGSGTRPRLDAGVLGITVAANNVSATGKPIAAWSAATFEVRSDGPVAAGIDGEAATLDPPLHFRSRPKALHVLIAPQHPGASPSAAIPTGAWDAIRFIARAAAHGTEVSGETRANVRIEGDGCRR